MSIIRYENYKLETVWMDGQNWIRLGHLSQPLGCASANTLRTFLRRNRDNFVPHEARQIQMETAGGLQMQWVVSLRGAERLAISLGTEQGQRFRNWALDMIAGLRRSRNSDFALTAPGTQPPIKEVVQALDLVKRMFLAGELTEEAIADLQSGKAGIPNEELLDLSAQKWKGGGRIVSEGRRLQTIAELEAKQAGYSVESLKRRVREMADFPQIATEQADGT